MSPVRNRITTAGTLAAGAAGWVLVGYPLSLTLARPRPARADARIRPAVSVLVCAAGDPGALAAKLGALRADDGYPHDRVQLVVAADGPAELRDAAAGAWPGALVLHAAERRGKAVALADALARATGEIVVLTDADNVLDRGALTAAIRWFADPEVWAVAGRRGETGSAYDRYEDLLRRLESRSGSVAAASGEFLAVRRERLRPVPAEVVNDDLWILLDVLARGGRVVYEPAAGGTEPALHRRDEHERRARIGAGRAQLAGELRRLPPRAAWRVANHKFARLAVPPLAGIALAALPAARHPVARAVLGAELAVVALGGGHTAGWRPPQPWLARLAACSGQLLVGGSATAHGLWRAAAGRQPAVWKAVR